MVLNVRLQGSGKVATALITGGTTMEDTTFSAISIVQLLIPIVLPIVIGFLRKKVVALQGSSALWVNMLLNVVGQIIAGVSGGLVTSVALGIGGGLMGSGGASAVRSVAKTVKEKS